MALRKHGKWRYGDCQADIRAEIVRYSKEVGYLAEHFADAVCPCGGTVFAMYLDDDAGVASRVCAACDAEAHPIGDSEPFLDEAEEEECACPCGEEAFEITVGVSLFDVREALYRSTGVDLTAVEGIDAVHALTPVSELGCDFSKWPTVKHFTSWLGLCPNLKKTGGTVQASRTRRGKNRAAGALRLAAWAADPVQELPRRVPAPAAVPARRPKAVTATAHKLARVVYHLVRYGAAYVRKSEDEYATQVQGRVERAFHRRAKELGYEVRKVEPPAPAGAAAG